MSGNELTVYNGAQPRKSSDEKFCHACGRIINVHASHCVGCGAPQSQQALARPEVGIVDRNQPVGLHNQIYCHGCGSNIHVTAIQCPKCGAQNTNAVKKGSKDRLTAGLFALLLGVIGAHHFYLGNIGLGILYLLFCWTLIPMFIAFIEGIIYLVQSDETFARKYP